jgi:hypothetical protein
VSKVASEEYRMSFSVGGLQVKESVALAQAYRSGETWPEARERLLGEGVSSFPKLASQTRLLREVFDRVGHLTNALSVNSRSRLSLTDTSRGVLISVLRCSTASWRKKPKVIKVLPNSRLQPPRKFGRFYFALCANLVCWAMRERSSQCGCLRA